MRVGTPSMAQFTQEQERQLKEPKQAQPSLVEMMLAARSGEAGNGLDLSDDELEGLKSKVDQVRHLMRQGKMEDARKAMGLDKPELWRDPALKDFQPPKAVALALAAPVALWNGNIGAALSMWEKLPGALADEALTTVSGEAEIFRALEFLTNRAAQDARAELFEFYASEQKAPTTSMENFSKLAEGLRPPTYSAASLRAKLP